MALMVQQVSGFDVVAVLAAALCRGGDADQELVRELIACFLRGRARFEPEDAPPGRDLLHGVKHRMRPCHPCKRAPGSRSGASPFQCWSEPGPHRPASAG